MRPRHLTARAAGALLLALACGCSKSTTAPTTNTSSGNQGQVSSALIAASSLFDDGLAESTAQDSVSSLVAAIGGYSNQAAIRPFTWWQQITGVSRTWTFAWADTDSTRRPRTCTATLNEHLTGRCSSFR